MCLDFFLVFFTCPHIYWFYTILKNVFYTKNTRQKLKINFSFEFKKELKKIKKNFYIISKHYF